MLIPKPKKGEHAPYTIDYIGLLPDDGQVLKHLPINCERMLRLVRSLPTDRLTKPHADGEWTVQDILVHVIDTERVFAYRALRIGRGDTTALPSFPHEDYVPSARANQRPLDDILAEYCAVRQATLSLLDSFDEAALTFATRCNDEMTSLRALVYIIAGHELHHLHSIQQNYGGGKDKR
ncbi:MAG: DinB family protein [Chloroflexi bacterium]|nr:DinB family protein [Chloroflexota bacterium]